MIKLFVALSVLAVAYCQEYEFIDNLVDFEHGPYQHISLPYPYHNDRDTSVINIQNKQNNNPNRINKGFQVIELPAKLKDTQKEAQKTQEVKKSLLTVDTSLKSTACAVVSKLYGLMKTALSVLVLNTPALILGAIVVVGFCKVTSICTKINGIKTLSEAQREFNVFLTPERLDMATEFIQDALRTYRSIQAN